MCRNDCKESLETSIAHEGMLQWPQPFLCSLIPLSSFLTCITITAI